MDGQDDDPDEDLPDDDEIDGLVDDVDVDDVDDVGFDAGRIPSSTSTSSTTS